MMSQNLHKAITDSIVADFYDRPVMSNLARPHYVERMIHLTLGIGWRLVSSNWSGWDIQGPGDLKVEVKQSAARQMWSDRPSLGGRLTRGSFDIASRSGYFSEDSNGWVEKPGRSAHVCIFAWHPITVLADVDHRDPEQWEFYVVPESDLPTNQKRISLSKLAKGRAPLRVSQLLSALQQYEERFRSTGSE